MDSSSNTPNVGFDAWTRPFRDAMAAFASSPSAGAGAIPGMPDWSGWPNVGAWAGGGMPRMGAMSMGAGFPSGFSQHINMGPFAAMFEQLSTQAQGQWQQLVSQFAGGMGGPDDALGNWRRLMESMAPVSALGAFDINTLRDVLSTPQVGPRREHVERWQQAMLAQLDYQEASREFSTQLSEILKLATAHFQRRLTERIEAQKQDLSMRAVFDEWIEAGEQAWAERASSDEFIVTFGRFSNAQMRLRAAMADQVNRVAESLGLPTRDEVESDHRRIAMLERDLRRLRREVEDMRAASVRPADKGSAAAATPARPSSASATAAAPTVVEKKPRTVTKTARGTAKKAATKTEAAAGEVVAKKSVRPRRASASSKVLPKVTAPRVIGKAKPKPKLKAGAGRPETRRVAK